MKIVGVPPQLLFSRLKTSLSESLLLSALDIFVIKLFCSESIWNLVFRNGDRLGECPDMVESRLNVDPVLFLVLVFLDDPPTRKNDDMAAWIVLSRDPVLLYRGKESDNDALLVR